MGNKYTCKQSFEEWCLENNRQDLLDRWDYSKNELPPSQMPYRTKKKAYFKCPSNIHDSEPRRLIDVTDKPYHDVQCKACGVGKNNREDLTARVFGELKVLYFDEERSNNTGNTYWVCRCSCGECVSVLASKLKAGNKRTCGGKYRHKNKINQDEIRKLRSTGEYLTFKKSVIEKDNGRCIVCGGTQDIEVHHLFPFATYIAERFNINNGICVCAKHHSSAEPGGYHNIFGTSNNTPEQFENYVNFMREHLGIKERFDVYDYMNPYDADDREIDDYMLDLYE